MQTLFEAANHIAQEIERTRQHLMNLEQALEGLKPLITVDAATTTVTYALSSQAQPVEDLSVVNAKVKSKRKTQSKPTEEAKPEGAKAAKAKVPKAKAVEAKVAAEPVKLPATGADLWLKCLGRKKVTVAQLADAALKKLKLDDSAREVITTRAKAWTYIATKKGDLVVAGTRDGSKLYQLAPVNVESQGQTVQVAGPAEPVETVEVAPTEESSVAA